MMASCVVGCLTAEFKALLLCSWFVPRTGKKAVWQSSNFISTHLSYHHALSLTCWSIQTPCKGCLIGSPMIAGHKSCHPFTPRIRRLSASVYPELVRFISQLPGVKGMNDMNTLENSRKLKMSVAAPLSAPDNYPGFICSGLNLFNISLRRFGHSGFSRYFSHLLQFRRYLEMPKPHASIQLTVHIQHTPHRQLLSILVTSWKYVSSKYW